MENNEFLKQIKKYGGIKPAQEAFKDYPVEEEEHKGKIESYVAETIDNSYNICYEIGDIVFVKEYKYENGLTGENHLFVIIEKDNIAVPIEYFGMLLSSKIEKIKYEQNKYLPKDDRNNLKVDSIVKTDVVYQILNNEIACKIGKIDKIKIEEYKNSYLEIKKKQEERERYITGLSKK